MKYKRERNRKVNKGGETEERDLRRKIEVGEEFKRGEDKGEEEKRSAGKLS